MVQMTFHLEMIRKQKQSKHLFLQLLFQKADIGHNVPFEFTPHC